MAKKGASPWNKGQQGYTTGKHKLPHSAETHAKLSAALKGRTAPNKGKPFSAESKRRMAEAHKGQHSSPTTEFKKGEHRSPSTEFKAGRTISPDERAKLCEGQQRRLAKKSQQDQGAPPVTMV